MICVYYNNVIFYDLTVKVPVCRLHVILVDWPRVWRWRHAVDTLGSLSLWNMLALHPNMSLGLMCAKVCWDEGLTVLIYSWSCLCHRISHFVAWYMHMNCHFRHPTQSPGYRIERGILCSVMLQCSYCGICWESMSKLMRANKGVKKPWEHHKETDGST